MSREDKKISCAMRLFEALSDVDSELLARSEEKVTVTGIGLFGRRVNGIRLAGSIAAAACLFLVGTALWVVSPVIMRKGASQEKSARMEEAVEEEYQAVKEEGAEYEEVLDEQLGTPLDSRHALTEVEARAVEGLGEYIPDVLPEGYILESCRAGVNVNTGNYDNLFFCWTREMDSIMITVSLADGKELVLADVNKPETYDVHLYEIPYAGTVPDAYREVFQNPVFAAEDLSEEIVRARMKAVADAGDTDTPRGNFSVYYEEGILLRFSGDGAPEEIWDMFQSMK